MKRLTIFLGVFIALFLASCSNTVLQEEGASVSLRVPFEKIVSQANSARAEDETNDIDNPNEEYGEKFRVRIWIEGTESGKQETQEAIGTVSQLEKKEFLFENLAIGEKVTAYLNVFFEHEFEQEVDKDKDENEGLERKPIWEGKSNPTEVTGPRTQIVVSKINIDIIFLPEIKIDVDFEWFKETYSTDNIDLSSVNSLKLIVLSVSGNELSQDAIYDWYYDGIKDENEKDSSKVITISQQDFNEEYHIVNVVVKLGNEVRSAYFFAENFYEWLEKNNIEINYDDYKYENGGDK